MRKLSYILLMPLAWFGAGLAFRLIEWPLRSLFGSSFAYPFSLMADIPAELIKLLILYRALCWIKSKSFTIPDQYSGFMVFLGALAIVPMLLVIIGYGYFILAKVSGVSGVPLGMALGATGLIAVIPVVVAELRNLYALLPAKAGGSV